VLDVLLVPATAGGSVVPPFQLNFASPTARSITTTRSSSSPPLPAVVPTTTATTPPVEPASRAGAATTPDPARVDAPAAPPAPSGSTFVPALTEDQQRLTATAPILQISRPGPVLRSVPRYRVSAWVRVLALLEALGGALIALRVLRSDPSPEADPAVRGIGAFVARREGAVPSL
jgi:hypothetical protein